MVKYGKEFRFVQKKEWKGKYLDYKKLKKQIKVYVSPEYKENRDVKKKLTSETVKHFTGMLDEEIKRMYLFFNKEEKLLHKDINTKLYSSDDYPTLERDEFIKEFTDLYKVSLKALDLAKFIYYNFKALIKIVKKFDKKFLGERTKLYIKYKYIQYKLEEQNSDILDMYKFKIIDEVCALIEDLVNKLYANYKKSKHLFEDEKMEDDNKKEQTLLKNEIILNENMKNVSGMNLYKEILDNIKSVDQYSLEIKTLMKPWDDFLKISTTINNKLYEISKEIGGVVNKEKTVSNNVSNLNINQIELDGSNYNVEGFNQLESSHLSSSLPFLANRKHSILTNMIISSDNKTNANIIFIQTFLYFFSYSIQIPFNIDYIEKFNVHYSYTGLLNAMAPLGALISFSYSTLWSFYSTKKPCILAMFFLVSGNICCTLSKHFKLFYLLLLGRFIIGLGCNRIGNKMYLFNFIPKQYLSQYITFFHVFTLLGLSFGFFANIPIILYFKNKTVSNYIDVDNAGALICSFFSLIVFFYALFTLTEAFNPNFFPTKFSFEGKQTTIKRNNEDKEIANNNNKNEENKNMTLDESIRRDKNMIIDINEKLEKFNNENEYVDNNLVAKSVRQLTRNEKKHLRFLKGSFIVFVTIVFASKVINEFIVINSPLYLHKHKENSISTMILSLLLGLSFLIVLLIEFVIFLTKKCFSDRTSLLIFLVFIFVLSLLCILQYFDVDNDWEYYVGMVGLIILSNFLEKTASSFFAHIISNDYKVCCIQGNSVINIATNLGRMLGAGIPMLSKFVKFEWMNIGTFSVFILLSCVAFVIALCFYEDLRVKSISRILENEKNQDVQIPNEI